MIDLVVLSSIAIIFAGLLSIVLNKSISRIIVSFQSISLGLIMLASYLISQTMEAWIIIAISSALAMVDAVVISYVAKVLYYTQKDDIG
ncbi:hypothetical protein ACSU1N_06400 [Thermogladius sp. 4427co]|uniref:hypothetical protein n=1 Tax=Thermogladius sp. 4427co TaxID=3450718 RepID=UPI003F797D9B